MPRIVIALFSFLFLVPQGLLATAQLGTAVFSKVAPPTTSCTAPTSTSTTFLTTDTALYFYFEVSSLNAGDYLEVAFYTPSGQYYDPAYNRWNIPSSGNYCPNTNSYPLWIAGNPPATMSGTWTVEIFYNGNYNAAFAKGTFTITSSGSTGGPSVTASSDPGSVTTNPFYYTNLASLTGNSMISNNDARDIFGGTFTGAAGENGRAIFVDTVPSTGYYSLQFQTKSPVQLTGYTLYLADDGTVNPASRSATRFTFLAGTSPSALSVISQTNLATLGSSYYNMLGVAGTAGVSPPIKVTDTFAAAATYQYFEIRFTPNNGTYPGVRVVELVATGTGGGTTSTVYYRFENGTAGATATGSGSIVDSTGNQNGTPSGAVTYSSDVPLSTVAGAANARSLQLASNGSVQFPGAFPLNSLTNATLEFYIKPTGTGSEMDFLWTRTDATDANRFNMGVLSGTSIFLDYRESNGTRHAVASIPISSSGWTHVAVVKSGNTWTSYANGVQQGSAVTDSSPNLPTNTGWTLNGRGSPQFAGLLDEFRISNSALAPAQFLPPVSGAAGTCNVSLSATSASVLAAQTNGSITVTTSAASCTWTLVNTTSWITVASGVTFTGNGAVNYTVTANTGAARAGSFTIAGQTFTVNQAAAAPCGYTISPTSNNMPAQGGSSSITVTVTGGGSCSWSASVSSSASSWLHLGSNTSGTTSGSVSYSADANTSTVSRTGTIAFGSLTFTLTQAGGASATAPSINQGGIVNAVSNRGGGGIAQGSMLTIYGTTLGPDTYWKAYQFPLPDNQNGVTVSVTQGSTTLKAYLLFVRADQINAIMPSSVRLGDAQVTVTYNGIIGASATVTIVKVAFGMNSANYGTGPGIIQNYNTATDHPFNGLSTPAKPRQVEIIVGTGLGAITTPDNVSPPGGAPTTPVQVVVGGIPADVTYSGRAPGNAGQDQINFTVPANAPLGCHVPVQVSAGGIWSNAVSMAISADGKQCQDSFSPFGNVSSTGGNAGTIGLIRVKFNGQSTKTGGPINAALDLGIGAFVKNSPGGDVAYSPLTNLPPPGACSSTTNTKADQGALTSNIFSIDPTIASTLDAGAQLTVTGGAGGASGTMTQSQGTANPYAVLLGGTLNISSSMTVPPPFLDGGPFTVSGPGGKDVGPFTTNIALTPAITWTNPPSTINRASPLTLTWTGGDSTEVVVIGGSSTDQTSKAYGGFTCVAPAGAHSFTVPVNTLADLIPVGVATSSTGAFGMLLLMPLEPGSMQFTPLPKGLDVGVVFDTTATMQQVQVQ